MTPKPTLLEWAAIGLVLVAQLLWDGHPPLISPLAAPVLLVGVAIWGLGAFRPTALARLPGLAARSTETSAGLVLVAALMCADQAVGPVAQVVAAVLLARAGADLPPARRAVDVAALWRGWPARALTTVLALAGLVLGSGWDGSYYSTITYDTGDYYSTITTTIPGTDAWGVGYGHVLGLLLALPVVGLLVTAWRDGVLGRGLLLAGPAFTLLASLALAARDSARVDGATGYSSFKLQAAGPTWMTLLMLVALAAAAWVVVAGVRAARAGGPVLPAQQVPPVPPGTY